MRLIVTSDNIEVVSPLGTPEYVAIGFAQQHIDWIQQAKQRLQQKKPIKSLAPPHYIQGAKVPFEGSMIPLAINPTSKKRIHIELSPTPQFIVHYPNMTNEADSLVIRQALENFMKAQAKITAQTLIAKHSVKHHLNPRHIRIKTMTSRWGSCGPHNDINLNWLLMLAPHIVFEYVVIHELCHIKHKNHSPHFWSLVADHMPNYQAQRQWLKSHGSRVMKGL